MSRFIMTRTEVGVQFTLRSDKERVLAVSKPYATLDACKKAVCSLVQYAPACPVWLASEGHCANPKFEITETAEGFCYDMKAPNGKSVIAAGPFVTKKACLRAVSMLRARVQNATVQMEQPDGMRPLTVGKLTKKTH